MTCVTPGGPAEKAGVIGADAATTADLTPGGDLIIAIDGFRIRNFPDLLSYLIRHTEVGQTVVLTVQRQGQEVAVDLTIGPRP